MDVCTRVRECSLVYPVCNVHAPCCDVTCGLSGSFTFFYIMSQRPRFSGKKLLNTKCVFIFSTSFAQNISQSKKKLARHCHKCENGFMLSTPLFLSGFNKALIFSTGFRKSLHIKFHQNPCSGSRVVPCGRTDGQTDGRTINSHLRLPLPIYFWYDL